MTIKKFLNDPERIVEETIAGLCEAYPEILFKVDGENVVRKTTVDPDKVQVVIGNGSGHEPACCGFVGRNMLSANAFGAIFAAPGPDTTEAAIASVATEKGVVVLISNHAGDVINSKMAIDMALDDGYLCKGVILYDDVASAPKGQECERRGTAGTLFNYKITGSYAQEGHSLDEVVRMSEAVRDNTRTIAVALKTGSSPITGENMFELPDDEIEIGMGVHGEAAALNMKMASSREIAEKMVRILVEDKPYTAGDEVAVLVNGCGQTTLMEQLIFFNDVKRELEKRGIRVYKPKVGSYVTSQEMGGISLAFCKLNEDMKRCWAAETDAPYFK